MRPAAVNKLGTGCPGGPALPCCGYWHAKTGTGGVNRDKALTRGQIVAHPGGQRGRILGLDPITASGWGRGGGKNQPHGHSDIVTVPGTGQSRGQRHRGGGLYRAFPFTPPKHDHFWGVNTRLASGCAWRGEAAAGRCSPQARHMHRGPPLPSPDGDWGALLYPQMQTCTAVTQPAPPARLQNLTQKWLMGGGHDEWARPLGTRTRRGKQAPVHRDKQGGVPNARTHPQGYL